MGLAFVPSKTVTSTGRVAPGALGAAMGAAAVDGKPVKLLPGQGLHTTPGKGTHAGPAAPPADAPPYAPLMTPEQIAHDAANTANLQIAGQVAPFQSSLQQTAAAGQLQQQQAGLFSTAAGKLLGSIGPSIQQGFDTAAHESAGLAKGIEGPVQQELGQTQDANAALEAQWNGPGHAPTTIDPTALGNATYVGGGFIPSNQLVTNAQAQNAWAQGLKGVEASQGMADQQSIGQATASAEGKINDHIAQVVAKYPQLFTAQEHADITNNLKAAGVNVSAYSAANTAAYQSGELSHLSAQDAIAAAKVNASIQATRANLRVKVAGLNATIAFHNGELKIQGSKAQTAWLNAQVKANGINYGASKVAGVLVDNAGNVIKTKAGKAIPVDSRVYNNGGVKKLTSTQIKNSPAGRRAQAQAWVVKEYGSAVSAPKDLQLFGKYVLAPGLKGDPTQGDKQVPGLKTWVTSNETRAEKGSTLPFAKAVNTMATQFRISRAAARKILIQSGIKPDGVRGPSANTQSPFAPGAGIIPDLSGASAPTAPFSPNGSTVPVP